MRDAPSHAVVGEEAGGDRVAVEVAPVESQLRPRGRDDRLVPGEPSVGSWGGAWGGAWGEASTGAVAARAAAERAAATEAEARAAGKAVEARVART